MSHCFNPLPCVCGRIFSNWSLPTTIPGATPICCANDLNALRVEDSDPLTSGAALYSLIRGSNGCGDGTYGHDSGGAERVSVVCP